MLLVYWTKCNINSRVNRALRRIGADYLEDAGHFAIYQTEENPDRVKYLLREFTQGEFILSNVNAGIVNVREQLDASGLGRVFSPSGAGELKPHQRAYAIRNAKYKDLEKLGNKELLLYLLLGDSQEPQAMRDYRINLSPDSIPHNWLSDEEGFERTIDDWYTILNKWRGFAWLWCQKWNSAQREHLERWTDRFLHH